jgi:hypothetical protein
VLKEIPLGIFVLTFDHCLRQDEGITICVNPYGKEQLLDKPPLKECAIDSYKSPYIEERTSVLSRANKHSLKSIGLGIDL